jgi:ANTAR domain-containing protein
MQSAIDIVLRRFAEYHDLEGAFGRGAVTERAKGILMERHNIDEQAAFNMLRETARRTNRKLVDIVENVVSVRSLLRLVRRIPATRRPPPSSGRTSAAIYRPDGVRSIRQIPGIVTGRELCGNYPYSLLRA